MKIKRDRSRIDSQHSLPGLILHKCLTSGLDPLTNTEKDPQFLEFYKTVIGEAVSCQARNSHLKLTNHSQANSETKGFKDFYNKLCENESETLGMQHDPMDTDIGREIYLLKDIKDIRDELQIFLVIFHDQLKVINDSSSLGTLQGTHFDRLKRTVERYISEAKRLDNHAQNVYVHSCTLPHLLELFPLTSYSSSIFWT